MANDAIGSITLSAGGSNYTSEIAPSQGGDATSIKYLELKLMSNS